MASAYDTLDHVNTDNAKTIADVYRLILGKAMEAKDLCGVVCTGPLNQSQSQSGDWGRHPLTFNGHNEVWHVRCSPPGRMGEPLMPCEVRRIAVLLRESKDSKESVVTTIKLWRLAGSTEKLARASTDRRQRERGRCTSGPLGVSTHGINLFERRATSSSTFPTSDGTQTVLSGIVSISQDQRPSITCKIEHQVAASYMLSAALAGAKLSKLSFSWNCQERYTETAWTAFCDASLDAFKKMCCRMDIESIGTQFALIMAAEDVLEQASFIGYLDQRADAFSVGALPDDMHKPSGLPLMLVIAVCVACNPTRWGMSALHGDDLFATKEASLFIESVLPTILAFGTEQMVHEQLHSFDVVINYGIDKVREVISMLKSGKYESKKSNVGYRWPERALEDTMHYLLCTGIAVCVDLFGLRPNPPPDGPLADMYTPLGLATAVRDPIMASREQSAHECGLGNTFPRWETLRTSTRGRRQLALAAALVEVDTWLRTGKYKDVVLRPTTEASVSVRQEELDPSAKPVATTTTATATTTAAATAAKSAKKKKRPEALLAERSRMRVAKQHYCAKEAVRAIVNSCGSRDEKYIAAASEELCDHAIASATGIFSDILQHGACVGMADLFKFSTYLVSPSSKVPCAHCENEVNVVESVAFSGAFGRCSNCRHPRCLRCVSSDINAREEYDVHTCPEDFKTCRFCRQGA